MQISWSEAARKDLRGILAYVGVNFGHRKAEEVLADIREQVSLLKDFPRLGRVFVKDKDLVITYRSLATRLNKIVYFIDDDTINIVSVWQNRRDVAQLKKSLKK